MFAATAPLARPSLPPPTTPSPPAAAPLRWNVEASCDDAATPASLRRFSSHLLGLRGFFFGLTASSAAAADAVTVRRHPRFSVKTPTPGGEVSRSAVSVPSRLRSGWWDGAVVRWWWQQSTYLCRLGCVRRGGTALWCGGGGSRARCGVLDFHHQGRELGERRDARYGVRSSLT